MFTFKQLTPLAIALITATALLGCNKNSESPPKTARQIQRPQLRQRVRLLQLSLLNITPIYPPIMY